MNKCADLHLVTFDRTSAQDVIKKLRREIGRIDSTSEHEFAGDHVINAFWTAWYLHEWVWDAIRDQPELKAEVLKYRGIDQERIDDPKAFGLALARRFVPLNICWIIATSPKRVHVVLGAKMPNDDSSAFGSDVVSANSNEGDDPSSPGMIPMIIVMGKTSRRDAPAQRNRRLLGHSYQRVWNSARLIDNGSPLPSNPRVWTHNLIQ